MGLSRYLISMEGPREVHREPTTPEPLMVTLLCSVITIVTLRYDLKLPLMCARA